MKQLRFTTWMGMRFPGRLTEIEWDAEAAEKGGFEHFMMKEIHEQPKAVADTLTSVIRRTADWICLAWG